MNGGGKEWNSLTMLETFWDLQKCLALPANFLTLRSYRSYSGRQLFTQNLDKKWVKTTLNFDTFYLGLLRLSEDKSFKWLIRHKIPPLRTTSSLIKRPIIQNPTHTSSSKHQVLHWNSLTYLLRQATNSTLIRILNCC